METSRARLADADFYRRGDDRRRRGAGGGLDLAREIVGLHKGAIEVPSRPGTLSAFSVRRPRGAPGTLSPEARR